MKRKLKFIHIGHHKCGSTFFQYEVIPKIAELKQPSGKLPNGLSNLEFRRSWIALSSQGEAGYDAAWVQDNFTKLDYNCLSNEAFVGFGTAASSSGMSIRTAAQRLYDLFGETKILIIIRNQKSVVKSMYFDDIEFGHVCGFEDWFHDRVFHFQLDWFRYSYLIEVYQEIFGKKNVKVLLFEDLFNKKTFLDAFDYFGVDPAGLEKVNFARRVNPGLSRFAATLSRLAFHFIGTRANSGHGILYRLWLAKVVPSLNRMDRFVGQFCADADFSSFDDELAKIYGADNKKVEQLTGLSLNQHGYPIADLGGQSSEFLGL